MATSEDGTQSGGVRNALGSDEEADASAPGEDADAGGSLIGRLVGAVASGVTFLIRDLWRYVQANDVDLEVSDHRVQFAGDDEGVEQFEADLTGLVAGRDLTVQYDEGGLYLELERLSDRPPLTLSF